MTAAMRKLMQQRLAGRAVKVEIGPPQTAVLKVRLTRREEETRRLAAAQDMLSGMLTDGKVARKYGVSRASVSRWRAALKRGGEDLLKARRAPGRPPRLTAAQFATLTAIFHEGAIRRGFPDARWTPRRFGLMISRNCGVSYTGDHVSRILKKLRGGAL